MDHTTIVTMRSMPKPEPRLSNTTVQRLILVAIAALVAVIIVALFLPRSAHGEDGMKPVAYLPLMQANLQKYPVTVLPVGTPWVAPTPTATPQPELGQPPIAPTLTPEVQ